MTCGAASGPVTATVPLAAATARSRPRMRKSLSVIEIFAVGGAPARRRSARGPPSTTPPCAARLPLALSRAENSRIVEPVAVAGNVEPHIVQHRAGREILVTAARDGQAPARGGRGNRAVHRGVEREPAGNPVLAERQQIGEVRDLAGARARAAPGARCGGTAAASVCASNASGAEPRRPSVVALGPGNPPVQVDLAAVPVAGEIERERRQPLLPRRRDAQRTAGQAESAARRRRRTVDRGLKTDRAAGARISRRAGRSRPPAGRAPRAAATAHCRAAPRRRKSARGRTTPPARSAPDRRPAARS